MMSHLLAMLAGVLLMAVVSSGAGSGPAQFGAGFLACTVLAVAILKIKAVRRALAPRHRRRVVMMRRPQPRQPAAPPRPVTSQAERSRHKHPPKPQPRAVADQRPKPADQVTQDVTAALIGLGARRQVAVELATRARRARPAADFPEVFRLAAAAEVTK